jgi:hypothetical protein
MAVGAAPTFKTPATGVPVKMAAAPTAKDRDFRSVINKSWPFVIARPNHAHTSGERYQKCASTGGTNPPTRKVYCFHDAAIMCQCGGGTSDGGGLYTDDGGGLLIVSGDGGGHGGVV